MADLGLIVYRPADGKSYTVKWGKYDLQEGLYFDTFLPVSMTGTGETHAIQIFNFFNRSLGMIAYTTSNSLQPVSWGNSNMGEGPGYLDFLAVTMNGDGKTQIVQTFDHYGNLGMIVYSSDGTSYKSGPWQGTQNIGEGSGAIDFIPVTVAADGKTHIVQIFENGATLGAIRYTPQSDGSYVVGPSTGNINATNEGFAYLPVTMNGDGVSQIVQLVSTVTGSLGWRIISLLSDGTYGVTWRTDTLGIPALASHFITVAGPANKTQIIQVETANSPTGLVVYSPQLDGSYAVSSRSPIGNFAGLMPVATTSGNSSQFAVYYNNGGRVGIDVYSPTPAGYGVTGSTPDTGTDFSALQWLPLTGADGVTELLQFIPTP